jgi:hypothetical protein
VISDVEKTHTGAERHFGDWDQVQPFPVFPCNPFAACLQAETDHLRVEPWAISKIDSADIAMWRVLENCSPIIYERFAQEVAIHWPEQKKAVGTALVSPEECQLALDAPGNSDPDEVAWGDFGMVFDCELSKLRIAIDDFVNRPFDGIVHSKMIKQYGQR